MSDLHETTDEDPDTVVHVGDAVADPGLGRRNGGEHAGEVVDAVAVEDDVVDEPDVEGGGIGRRDNQRFGGGVRGEVKAPDMGEAEHCDLRFVRGGGGGRRYDFRGRWKAGL